MSLSKGKGVKGLQKSVTLNVQKEVAKKAKVSHDTVSYSAVACFGELRCGLVRWGLVR